MTKNAAQRSLSALLKAVSMSNGPSILLRAMSLSNGSWTFYEAIKIGKIHTGLGQLLVREFTFFAIPVKVRGAASFPVKAFVAMG